MKSYKHIFHPPFMYAGASLFSALISLSCVVSQAQADAVTRHCNYQLFVKSNQKKISSSRIPNGLAFFQATLRGPGYRKDPARTAAAQIAMECLPRMLRRNDTSCRRRIETSVRVSNSGINAPRTAYGKVTLRLTTILPAAAKQLCKMAQRKGLGRNGRPFRITDMEVWTRWVDRSKGKKHCKIPDGKRDEFFSVARRIPITCHNGRVVR